MIPKTVYSGFQPPKQPRWLLLFLIYQLLVWTLLKASHCLINLLILIILIDHLSKHIILLIHLYDDVVFIITYIALHIQIVCATNSLIYRLVFYWLFGECIFAVSNVWCQLMFWTTTSTSTRSRSPLSFSLEKQRGSWERGCMRFAQHILQKFLIHITVKNPLIFSYQIFLILVTTYFPLFK